MVLRKVQRGIFLLIPIYICLVFMAFFAFLFTGDRHPKKTFEVMVTVDDFSREAVNFSDAKFNGSIRGVLNLHVWKDLCGLQVDSLRETPLFPHHPHERLFLKNFGTSRQEENYGQRIFGFIVPKVSGLYKFGISSDDTSELWLSFDDKPSNLRLIASVFSPSESAWTNDVVFSKYPMQQSRNIRLLAHDRYFVEVLHKQSTGNGHVEVYWQKPQSHKLEAITGQFLYSFFNDRKSNESKLRQQDLESLYTWTPSHTKQGMFKGTDLSERFNYTSLPFFNKTLLKGVLPTCAYKPSYIVETTLKRYKGVTLVHLSSVYPNDSTYLQPDDKGWARGNFVIDDQTANEVVDKFMANLLLRHR